MTRLPPPIPQVMVFLTSALLWCACGDDNPASPGPVGGTVSHTNFVVRESFSFSVNVQAHTRLRLRGVSGLVRVVGNAIANAVSIDGERRVRSESVADAQQHLPQLQVRHSDLGDEIFVETVQPSDTGGRSYEVDYRLTLPAGLEVSLTNVNGEVSVATLNNTVSVTNVNGKVELEGISGDGSVELVNGQIEAQVTLPTGGTLALSTVNGAIDLEIPASTSAQLSINVANGTIEVSNLALQNSVSTTRSVEGTLGTGRGRISLSTVNGNISVTGT